MSIDENTAFLLIFCEIYEAESAALRKTHKPLHTSSASAAQLENKETKT